VVDPEIAENLAFLFFDALDRNFGTFPSKGSVLPALEAMIVHKEFLELQ
jgi:hypothetical protein